MMTTLAMILTILNKALKLGLMKTLAILTMNLSNMTQLQKSLPTSYHKLRIP
jgi:hypothetical protein